MNAIQHMTPFARQATSRLQPLPLLRAIPYFVVPGLTLRFTIYTGIPWMISQGLSAYEAFIVAFTVPLAILFALAFGLAKYEGVPENLFAFARRFRLHRLTGRHILWVIVGFVVSLVMGLLVAPTREWILNSFPILQPPATFPPILDPALQNQNLPAVMAQWLGAEAIGNWDLVVLALVMFFFNIFGEELFFRGLILPRQELVHGRWAWLAHGLLWNLFHLFIYPWYLLYGLPLTLTISWVAQKTGNTWAPILLHTFSNITMYVLIIGFVSGAF